MVLATDSLSTSNISDTMPLIISCIDGRQSIIAQIASYILQGIRKSTHTSVVEIVVERKDVLHEFAEQVSIGLQQGAQNIVIVPWGQLIETASLIETAQKVLAATTKKEVSFFSSLLPSVQLSNRIYSLFGGFAYDPPSQLQPLLDIFPHWDRFWTELVVESHRILLLRSLEWPEKQDSDVYPTLLDLLLRAIESNPVLENGRRSTDGTIYLNYLTALLSAALKQTEGRRYEPPFLLRTNNNTRCDTNH